MVDSTCCRAHQSSAGAPRSCGQQAIGITRGGLNTKIHTVCDALGNPLRFVLTAGQRHDSKPMPELLGGLQAKALLAGKAYGLGQACAGCTKPRHASHHPLPRQP
ncbi:MAG: transposase, family [Polaromonas sp.]|nr:transposase, family [Polaromonas sp.]